MPAGALPELLAAGRGSVVSESKAENRRYASTACGFPRRTGCAGGPRRASAWPARVVGARPKHPLPGLQDLDRSRRERKRCAQGRYSSRGTVCRHHVQHPFSRQGDFHEAYTRNSFARSRIRRRCLRAGVAAQGSLQRKLLPRRLLNLLPRRLRKLLPGQVSRTLS